MADIEYWQHRLDFNDPEIVEVELSNIIEAKDIKMPEMLKAAEKRCWFSDGQITEKAKKDLGIEIENFNSQVKAASAEDQGFSGIKFGYGENIVVWDISAINIK